MFIEKIWPYLTTPIVYVVVMAEALAALMLAPNYALVSIALLWALLVAILLSSFSTSRAFRVERLIFLVSLAIAQTTLFAIYLVEVNHLLHLHDEQAMSVARLVYALVWLILMGASILAYARNTGPAVPRMWPLIVLLTLLVVVFPIEPDAFVDHQPAWLWMLRINLAVIGFILVSIGDSANVLAATYQDRSYRRDRGHPVVEPGENDFDMSLIRTLLWSPLTLWVMFVPRLLLLAWILPAVLLVVLLARRWQRATLAQQLYIQRGFQINSVASGVVSTDEVIMILDQLEGDALDRVVEQIAQRQEYERDDQERHHQKFTTATADGGARKRNHKQDEDGSHHSKHHRRRMQQQQQQQQKLSSSSNTIGGRDTETHRIRVDKALDAVEHF